MSSYGFYFDLIAVLLYIIFLVWFVVYYGMDQPHCGCPLPGQQAQNHIEDFLKRLKRYEKTVIVDRPSNDIARSDELLVFRDHDRLVLGGFCDRPAGRSHSEFISQHHVEWFETDDDEELNVRFMDEDGKVHYGAIDCDIENGHWTFNESISCKLHPECNPDVPEDLKIVLHKFLFDMS